MAPELQLFKVDVVFNPVAISLPTVPLFTFTLDGVPNNPLVITVKSGLAMIVFNLTTVPGFGQDAYFQTVPIQWLGTGEDGLQTPIPVAVPGMFAFERSNDQVVRLTDFNSNSSTLPRESVHWFNLVVSYGGKTYGADPSIVNQPPIDG